MATAPSPRALRPRAGRSRVLALSAACALALSLPGCGAGPGNAPETAASPSRTAPAPTPTASAGDGSVATTKLPVYWVGPADGEQALFREFRDATEGSGAVDPIAAAAALMTASSPQDPDYRTLWSPVEQVGSSTSPDGTITVDLPSEAFRSGLSDREARLALQQLVHTVAAAAGTAGLLPEGSGAEVVVLVDGRPGEEVFGSVRLDEPLRPDEELEAPLWLTDPPQDSRAQDVVSIAGRALDGVRDSRWTVTEKGDDSGATVARGTVDVAAQDDGTTRFEAAVELPPGDYVVTLVGRAAEGGLVRDDKEVEVLPG